MLGDRVKALREARAWTQEHLADAAGVSLRTIQRLENGSGFASETALAVAAALDVDVRDLLDTGARPVDGPQWRPIPARAALFFAGVVSLPALLFAATWLFRNYAGITLPHLDMVDSPMVVLGPPLALLLLWRWARNPQPRLQVYLPIRLVRR